MTFNECYQRCFPAHWSWGEILLWIMWLSITFIMGYFLYLFWWPIEPIRIDKIEIKSELHAGERTSFHFMGEKFVDVPAHVSIELVNGESIALMTYTSHNSVGTVFRERPFIVPYHIYPGKYRLKWTGVYEVTALRSITRVAYSDWVTIKDDDDCEGKEGPQGVKGARGERGQIGRQGIPGKNFWGK